MSSEITNFSPIFQFGSFARIILNSVSQLLRSSCSKYSHLRRNSSGRWDQIFAISLTYPVLEHAKWKSVVGIVERDLLTPYGLRTLSPMHADYRGRYAGDLEAAIAAAREASHLSGGAAVAETFLLCALTLAKMEPEATERFARLKERGRQSYVSPTLLAWIHGGRGELAAAHAQIAQAVSDRDSWLICYRMLPPPLQSEDPGIVTLLEKNNI